MTFQPEQSKIETQVMGSVAAIYAARTFLGPTALKLYALILSVWGIGRLVWVSKVFENLSQVAHSGVTAVGNFILAAVAHTHFGVQMMLLIAVVAGALLAFDFARVATTRGRGFAA